MRVGLAAAGARFVAAVGLLVHCGPGPTLGFVLRHATLLVALLDVLGLALLLVGIGVLITTRHDRIPPQQPSGDTNERTGELFRRHT
jgi:hypothetical protein